MKSLKRRIFIDEELAKKLQQKNEIILPGDKKHYIFDVLRMKIKDVFEAVDVKGNVFICQIIDNNGGIVLLKNSTMQLSKKPIWVAQALVKSAKFEQVIQRSTELGANKIMCFASERSLPTKDSFNEKKMSRFKKIAQSASEQSQRYDLPDLEYPITFLQLLEVVKSFAGLVVVGCTDTDKLLLKDIEINTQLLNNGVMIIVGPEGGFSLAEYQALQKNNAHLSKWGPYIMRTETAALFALSVVQAKLLMGKNHV